MIPKSGQYVKCVLINNTVLEGTVEEWLPDGVKLKSLDDKSILIIHHPERDIIITKIILPIEAIPEIKTELEQQFQEEYNKPSDDSLRNTNLAKLRIMMAEADKKIIAEKLKDHHISDVKKVQYGYPDLHKIKSSK